MDPNAFQVHQLTHLVDADLLRGAQPRATLGFQLCNLLAQKLVMRIHPQQTTTQATGNLRAVPQSQRVELLSKLAQARQASPWATAQTLEAGGRTGPLLLQRFQVPVQLP